MNALNMHRKEQEQASGFILREISGEVFSLSNFVYFFTKM